MAAFVIFIAFLGSYARTPQQAALDVFAAQGSPHRVAVRTNVAGRYATVLVRGGVMGGALVRAPILVEKFSFGWQAVDILNVRFCPGEHGVSRRENALLIRGMPHPSEQEPCAAPGDLRDAGPSAQVAAVRREMRGALIPSVAVSRNFAMGTWFGAAGGQSLYAKRAGRWHLIVTGGGAFGVREMRAYHVPQADWCSLRVYDAHCASFRRAARSKAAWSSTVRGRSAAPAFL